MNTDRNLLFGVLALQADLIDSQQFIEACTLWMAQKHTDLADLLIERGWIQPPDKLHLDYLLERKLQRHGGDAHASLAFADDNIKRSLVALGDADIQRSLADLPQTQGRGPDATVDYIPESPERYSRLRLHATGGIGRIWLARDSLLGRDIALKELRPEQADNDKVCLRFLKEAQITSQLEHPGIVPVYELGRRSDNGQPYYTMRFVKGRTLAESAAAVHEKRAAGPVDSFEWVSLLNAFVTACNTIAFAHSRGVLHRDLKGTNVVLGDFGEVVVLDWGLARLIDRAEVPEPPIVLDPSASSEVNLTVHGQAVGTPAYMAPEQAAGRLGEINHRTDVYGLGAILYEILTGRPPFTGSDTRDILKKVTEEEPLRPQEYWPQVPSALEAVCLRALAKNPTDRYSSATELGQEVQRWQDVQRRQAEEALRQSEALYHSLVETLPLQVWRKDRDCQFTFGNQRFCEAVGKSLQEIIGKTDFDFFPAELAEKYRRDDAWVIQSGKTWETSEDHVTPEGERLFVQVVKSPIFGADGEVVGTQGIFWDATEEQRLRQALDQVRADQVRPQS